MLLTAVQWNPCIMDALEPFIHKCTDYQDVLIVQFSLHAKAPFMTITKCIDYAGVRVFKCPD